MIDTLTKLLQKDGEVFFGQLINTTVRARI